jgi:hypothetical protein
MTRADKGNTTTATEQEPIDLPDWLPPDVLKSFQRIEAQSLPGEQRTVLLRLATDGRMRKVWTELCRRNRSNRQFVNAANASRELPSLTKEEVQAKALGEIFHFAFCAARDKRMVSKPEDVAQEKEKLTQKAAILRELAEMVEVSSFTIERAIPDAASRQLAIADAAALVRVASWLEHVAAALRPPSDPLMVQHHRGDPVVRGVQIEIAAQLKEMFGKVLHGTAATLTSVALATETSERVTRSAFLRQKQLEKGRLLKLRKRQ